MSPSLQPHSRLKQLLVLGLALVPPCLLAVLIFEYSVDLPQWDQWSYVPFFEKLSHGSLTFKALFRQVNEYRQFFPNVFFVALGSFTRWDVRYEMLSTFLVACLVSLNVYLLAARTIEGGRMSRLWLFVIANLFIFSPSQYQNWLQGQQLVYYVPIACITTCMLVAGSGLSLRSKFVVCGCLAVVSTFSSANGGLCWLVVFPVLMLAESPRDLTQKRWLIVGWIAGMLACAALYLYDYHKPWWSNPASTAFIHPIQAIMYFFGFLGAPLALEKAKVATVVGLILISALAFSAAFLFKRRANPALVRRMMIWLMIGAYSVLTAVMTTFGRLGFGVGQSQTTRYIGYSAYLIVGLIFLMSIINRDSLIRNDSGRQTVWWRRVAFGSAAIVLLLQPVTYGFFINRMAGMRTMLLQTKASVLFINLKPDPRLVTTIYPDLSELIREANDLNRLGYLRPGLIRTLRLQEFAAPGQSNPAQNGEWEQLTRLDNNRYLASGWATLPHRAEMADAIILAYQTADGETLMFHLERPPAAPARAWYQRRQTSGTWEVSFSSDELPGAQGILTAWGFDANTGKAFRLSGSFEVRGSEPVKKHVEP